MHFIIGGPRLLGHIRTGLIFGPDDLRKLTRSAPVEARRPSAFVYVVQGIDRMHVKVGISADPLARLRTLQTGSGDVLKLVYTAAVKSNDATAIERLTHDTLGKYRLEGEWFYLDPEIAVAAIAAASHRLGDPIVEIPVDKIGDVLAIAAARDAAAQPRRQWSPFAVFMAILGFAVCFAAVFVWLLNR